MEMRPAFECQIAPLSRLKDFLCHEIGRQLHLFSESVEQVEDGADERREVVHAADHGRHHLLYEYTK